MILWVLSHVQDSDLAQCTLALALAWMDENAGTSSHIRIVGAFAGVGSGMLISSSPLYFISHLFSGLTKVCIPPRSILAYAALNLKL